MESILINPECGCDVAAPAACDWAYTVRVGERVTLTAAWPHRLHRARDLGLQVQAFYYDTRQPFPVLHASLSSPRADASDGGDRLAVWTEEALDRHCQESRWDRAPLVHEERTDRWENSLILVDVRPAEGSEWSERCAADLGVPGAVCAAFARLALDLGEDHRRSSAVALPIVIAQALREAGVTGDLSDESIFAGTPQPSERETLRAKARQLARSGELVRDEAQLEPAVRAIRTALHESLRVWLAAPDLPAVLTLVRALLNILGYSPKEQDYLILLGSSNRSS